MGTGGDDQDAAGADGFEAFQDRVGVDEGDVAGVGDDQDVGVPQDQLFQGEAAAFGGTAVIAEAQAAGGLDPPFGDQPGLGRPISTMSMARKAKVADVAWGT